MWNFVFIFLFFIILCCRSCHKLQKHGFNIHNILFSLWNSKRKKLSYFHTHSWNMYAFGTECRAPAQPRCTRCNFFYMGQKTKQTNIQAHTHTPQTHHTFYEITLRFVFFRVRKPPIHKSANITWLHGCANSARWFAATANDKQLWFDHECSSQVSKRCARSASHR